MGTPKANLCTQESEDEGGVTPQNSACDDINLQQGKYLPSLQNQYAIPQIHLREIIA
jgi:hypothetical protein